MLLVVGLKAFCEIWKQNHVKADDDTLRANRLTFKANHWTTPQSITDNANRIKAMTRVHFLCDFNHLCAFIYLDVLLETDLTGKKMS